MPTLDRTVQVQSIEHYPADSAVIVRLAVKHTTALGQPYTEPDRVLSIFTNNEKKVRTAPGVEGQLAEKNEAGQYPADAVGEYDFLYWYRKEHSDGTSYALGELHASVIEFMVARMDARANFDDLASLS
jgi:hypothetical protein